MRRRLNPRSGKALLKATLTAVLRTVDRIAVRAAVATAAVVNMRDANVSQKDVDHGSNTLRTSANGRFSPLPRALTLVAQP